MVWDRKVKQMISLDTFLTEIHNIVDSKGNKCWHESAIHGTIIVFLISDKPNL